MKKNIADRIIAEKTIMDKMTTEKTIKDKIATEKAIKDRMTTEKAIKDRMTTEKAIQNRIATEKAIVDRIISDKNDLIHNILDRNISDSSLAEKRQLPIAFFDSGVGGISVLREAVKLLPNENFLFFGDSANAPYGTRTREDILNLTLTHAKRFYERGIKALVIACNTATSAAINDLREIYTDIPVIGIEPALKPAALMSEHPTVIVMATPMTVSARKFNDLLGHYADQADVIPLGCPGLMEFVEKGKIAGPEVVSYLESLLMPYLQNKKVDAIVLGCTHYPFLAPVIRNLTGIDVQIFDGGPGTARELKRRLKMEHLLRDSDAPGSVVFENSRPDMIPLCQTLLKYGTDSPAQEADS